MNVIVAPWAVGFIETDNYQDSEIITGEIGRFEEFYIYKTHESEFADMPKIDTRKFSKCKRIRRQARGWSS